MQKTHVYYLFDDVPLIVETIPGHEKFVIAPQYKLKTLSECQKNKAIEYVCDYFGKSGNNVCLNIIICFWNTKKWGFYATYSDFRIVN